MPNRLHGSKGAAVLIQYELCLRRRFPRVNRAPVDTGSAAVLIQLDVNSELEQGTRGHGE